MNIFKKIMRRPAIIVVSLWARMAYNKGVRAAEQRHIADGGTIYLACDSFHPDRLVTYNKAQFKTQKRAFGMSARLLTMNTLKSGCYYYTADAFMKNGISKRDKEIRRKAFVKERLQLARLTV